MTIKTNKPILADRGWDLKWNKELEIYQLMSSFAPDLWVPGGIVAECRCKQDYYWSVSISEQLVEGHSCGIHAIKIGMGRGDGSIFGQVALYGKVLEFATGWRATHAQITHLYFGAAVCGTCWHNDHANPDEDTPMMKPVAIDVYDNDINELICREHLDSRILHPYSPSEDYNQLLVDLAKYYEVPLVKWEGQKDGKK